MNKAKQFGGYNRHAAYRSDAFFPFDDCVHITLYSRDRCFYTMSETLGRDDSINYYKVNSLAIW
jgi:hypothetical protein